MNIIIDLILHLDTHLNSLFSVHAVLAYSLLFLLIFCETGLIVTPFLPGDSLIFATAALSASGGRVSIPFVMILFFAAAVAGDTVNYQAGHFLSNRVEKRRRIPFVKQKHIDRTQEFFERHGGKAIVIGRFIPIIRTFVPFVAGVGTMTYRKFLSYNVVGAVSWVALFFAIGYFFGNLPLIKNHFSLVLIAIIFISVLPAVFAFLKNSASGKSRVPLDHSKH